MVCSPTPHIKEQIMKNNPVLKAGLVGALILVAINLFALAPVVGCIAFPAELLAYVGIGALAVHWMAPPRVLGRSALNGASAAGIAAIVGGLVRAVTAGIGAAVAGPSTKQVLEMLPPETVEQLQALQFDPATLLSGPAVGGMALICCLPLGLVVGALLGALGGAIDAAIEPN
jgi:hypothetical protein